MNYLLFFIAVITFVCLYTACQKVSGCLYFLNKTILWKNYIVEKVQFKPTIN